MPRVALFIPCYIDQLYPDVATATLELLEHYGCEVHFPPQQTCCGQPMSNTGCVNDARPIAINYFNIFDGYDYIVCPSGSCAAMVRNHYHDIVGDAVPHDRFERIRSTTYELCEFLVDVLKVTEINRPFPFRVGLHQSCHGLRELRLGSCSELVGEKFSKAGQLLKGMQGIELVSLERADECCGFGGTFAVAEEAVSCMMGLDRVADHEKSGTEVLTAGDMSCLMHMYGLIHRQKKPLKVMHVAEILAGRQPN